MIIYILSIFRFILQKRSVVDDFCKYLFNFKIYTDTNTNKFLFVLCSYKEEIGTNRDMIKLSRHLLNRSVANRTISKQEAMCELGDLDLVICTESIETVSLSSSVKINYGGKNSDNVVQKYNKKNGFTSDELVPK